MANTPDHRSEGGSAEEVFVSVTSGDITVEKSVSLYRNEAVAVTLQLQSVSDSPTEIRLIDPLPESLRDHDVEFHPGYDPDNWTRADQAVVYESTLVPAEDRETVYGVLIDDASQLDLFAIDPIVEILDIEDVFKHWADDGPEAPDAPETTDPVGTNPEVGVLDQAADSDSSPAAVPSGEQVIESLIEAIERDDLTNEQLSTLREALEPGTASTTQPQPEQAREELTALRERMSTVETRVDELADTTATVVDLREELEAELRSLRREVERIEERVDRGERWRSELQQSLVQMDTDE